MEQPSGLAGADRLLKDQSSVAVHLPRELIPQRHCRGPVLRLAQPRAAGGLEAVVTTGEPAQLHRRQEVSQALPEEELEPPVTYVPNRFRRD
jgi:hypothetical protein